MKNKRLVYRIILTAAVLLALICNVLPLLSADFFGFHSSVSMLDFFDMELLETVLGLSGETNIVIIVKSVTVLFIVLDILAAMLCWAVRKRKLHLTEMVIGLLQAGWWLFTAILFYAVPELRELLDMGLSLGMGLWGMIVAGAVIFTVGLLLFTDKSAETEGAVSAGASEGALLGIAGAYAGARIPVGEVPVVLGRDSGVCHVILEGERVSRRHCSVVYDSSRRLYLIKDFSQNGTFLEDGRRLSAVQINELRPGEQLRVGQEMFALE